MSWFEQIIRAVLAYWSKQPQEMEYLPLTPPTIDPVKPPVAPRGPLPVKTTTMPPTNIDTLLPWNMTESLTHENFHNVRVICDLVGLTYAQKEILTACVWQESDFMTNPRPNQNKLKNGTVWSTDFGIVQVNDYYNIGAGKPFPSVKYVLDNPEACIRWMAGIMKSTGRLQPWASYTTGAYKKYLGKTL